MAVIERPMLFKPGNLVFSSASTSAAGANTRKTGALSPRVALPLLGFALALSACGKPEETRTLEPEIVGMNDTVAPIYDDGEMQLYEVKYQVQFPIIAPDPESRAALERNNVEPYGRQPWFTIEDVRIQLTWTLTNLDAEPHNVEVLIDPWNEFGRYYPGLALVDPEDEEYQPNLSGIDILYELPGTTEERSSRLHGTFTYDDMEELATDFATVMNIIENVEPEPAGVMDVETDPRIELVNHAFHQNNRSKSDVYTAKYVPDVIAGLAGIDMGLRTYEPANIALEIVAEVVDRDSQRVLERDSDDPELEVPEEYFTVGTAP
jgi:hypothetical protein